jgi:hypothetical protein
MLKTLAVIVAAFTLSLLIRSTAQAHVVCGDRVFPTTLTMDDPGTGDEISMPTLQFTPTPNGQSNSYGFEWDKSITEDLTFAINDDYITQRPGPGANFAGWDDVTLTLKDQHPCNKERAHEEFVWSVGLVREIPGTGGAQLANAGIVDTFGKTQPTFYFGKGMGDLKAAYLRPFAITGEVSRNISDEQTLNPNGWSYAASLQYSMPYLNQNIKAQHIPQWLTRLTPIVEVAMDVDDQGGTPTGTISPGFFYDAPKWQLAAEAVIPANAATRQNRGVGFILQYHLFLDTYYKSWVGRPIINTNLWGKQ